jgi:quinol monooxygenase YgiN
MKGECRMWAQLIRTRVKPGSEEGLQRLFQQVRDAEPADSGLVRTLVMREQEDPSALSMLVVFENEEKARARENAPGRDEALAPARATMAEIFDGTPTFTDLVVVAEYLPSDPTTAY